ncbi:hypothetical protein ACIHCM_17940 [Streptomyces sp. NPDC052023]|uniref:hypothetical protein n=1 Tax=Streptomyces sp. NPDC052023 TaxID=3365681 RepID=UPI0037CD7F24
MAARRSLTALTGVVMLGLVVTACEDHALGTIELRTERESVEVLSDPSVKGCHRFREGVVHVNNQTLNDIILYTTPDCTEPKGAESVYLPTETSDEAVRSTGLWRSFTVVH